MFIHIFSILTLLFTLLLPAISSGSQTGSLHGRESPFQCRAAPCTAKSRQNCKVHLHALSTPARASVLCQLIATTIIYDKDKITPINHCQNQLQSAASQSNQTNLSFKKKIVAQERASGMYRLSAIYFARSAADLPLDFAIPTIFIFIIYLMGHLRYSAAAFFANYFTVLLLALVRSLV